MYFRLLSLIALMAASAAAQQAAPPSKAPQPQQSETTNDTQSSTEETTPPAGPSKTPTNRVSTEHPPVKRSLISAAVSDEMTMTGTIHLELETEASLQREVSPLLLGRTNLQSLALSSGDTPISVAMDRHGNLIPLSQPGSREISGTWSAVGMPVSGSTVFHLELPATSVCEFQLSTDGKTSVTSPNSLVIPEVVGLNQKTWKLLPANGSRVTIRCTRQTETQTRQGVSLDVGADIRIDPNEASVTWTVDAPLTLPRCSVRFHTSTPCSVTSVTADDGSSIEWSTSPDQNRITLLPTGPSISATFTIQAKLPYDTPDELKIPLLIPEAWIPEESKAESQLALRSASVRLSVSPASVVTDLNLVGLYEKEVAYTGDGAQTIELTQFTKDAAATVMLTASRPLIDESVVMQFAPRHNSTQATAFVSVTARTGSLADVAWTLPASWRVTDVRELPTARPLLFRIDESNADAPQLKAFLRTPVTGAVQQTLRIKLQSTNSGGDPSQAPPSLTNTQYRRQHDYVVGHANESIRTGVESLSSADLRKLLPWLPLEEFKSAQAYRRVTSPTRTRSTSPLSEEVFATIDYSVARKNDALHESIQISVRCNAGIPQSIPLRITNAVEVRLSDESITQPPPSLKKSDKSPDEWLLEVASGSEIGNELDVRITTRRELTQQMAATVVTIPGATQTGGSIQPPTSRDGYALNLPDRDTPLTETIAYPTTSLKTMTLQKTAQISSQQKVSGIQFLILRKDNNNTHAEAAARLYVKSIGDQPNLKLRLPPLNDLAVFVNERSVFADQTGNELTIPLDNESDFTVVDLHFTQSAHHVANTIELPMIGCPDASSQHIVAFGILPAATRLSAASTSNLVSAQSPGSFTNGPQENYQPLTESKLAEELRPFLVRWQTAAANSNSAFSVSSGHDGRPVRILVRDTRFDTARMILWATLSALTWLAVSFRLRLHLWPPGLFIMIVTAVLMRYPDGNSPILSGAMYGTLFWFLTRLTRVAAGRLGVRNVESHRSGTSLKITVATTLFLMAWTCDINADERQLQFPPAASDSLLQKGDAEPLKTTLPEIQQADAVFEALVIDCDVNVTLESSQSASATIQCLVATAPDRTAHLVLPLPDDVTLIKCELDSKNVLPKRDPSGRTFLVLPNASALPVLPLAQNIKGPGSPGPLMFNDWKLRQVSYTIRTSPRWTADAHRIRIPHPSAPETRSVLSDPYQLVNSARIRRVPDSNAVNRSGRWHFPVLFTSRVVDVAVKFRGTKVPAGKTQQHSSVTCTADVSPTRLRLTTTYHVTPTDLQTDSLKVGTAPQHQILSVKSEDGVELAYRTQAGYLTVNIEPNKDGVQTVVVRESSESSLNLSHDAHVGRISLINDVPADSMVFVARTSDQFILNPVIPAESQLTEIPVPAALRRPGTTASSGRAFNVEAGVESIKLNLIERRSEREVRLDQEVAVGDESILWTCQCRISISGRPIYRQQLRVSGNIRIDNVTAFNGGNPRQQSWTRNGELVVVPLREATRGDLLLELTGRLTRSNDGDTQLPVIGLPDAHIFESYLELYSTSETDAYISDLGSTTPNVDFDIAADPVPPSPLRLTVRDENQPLAIRARPEQKLIADSAILVYEYGGHPLLAQALAIRSPGTAFDIRFRLKDDGFPDVSPEALRNGKPVSLLKEGNDYIIPRADRSTGNETTILIIDEVVPPVGDTALNLSLPEFDSAITISSHRGYDLRPDANPELDNTDSMPNWLSDAANRRGITDTSASATTARLTDYGFDTSANRYSLPPLLRETALPERLQKVTTSISEHSLNFHHVGRAAGHSDFLVFSSETNTTLPIYVSEDTIPTAIRVNGSPQAIGSEQSPFHVAIRDRVAHVEVEWFHRHGKPSADTHITVPSISQSHQGSIAFVKPPPNQPAFWAVRNALESGFDTNSERSEAIRMAVRSIAGLRPDTNLSSDENVPSVLAGTDTETWNRIVMESREAAISFASALSRNATDRDNTSIATAPDSAGRITIDHRFVPSPFLGFVFATGFLMLATSLTARRRIRRPSQNDLTEEMTAIRKPTASATDTGSTNTSLFR